LSSSNLPQKRAEKADFSWTGATYARVPPGIYSVVGKTSQGPEWLRHFSRWSLRVEFELLDDGQAVSRFFNMGNDPERPHIGQKSNYFSWWVLANGERPKRGQSMTPDVFFEGQVYRVRIEDASLDAEQKSKRDAEIYSRVTELIEVSSPTITQSLNQKSVKQPINESVINESPNQLINQSSRPPARRQRKRETNWHY
jgi:hypothetical protein